MSKKVDAEFDYVLQYVLYVKLVIHFLPPENSKNLIPPDSLQR